MTDLLKKIHRIIIYILSISVLFIYTYFDDDNSILSPKSTIFELQYEYSLATHLGHLTAVIFYSLIISLVIISIIQIIELIKKKDHYILKDEWEINRNEASNAGTKMHLDIEKFYNNIPVDNDSEEFSYFMNFHFLIKLRFANSINQSILNCCFSNLS